MLPMAAPGARRRGGGSRSRPGPGGLPQARPPASPPAEVTGGLGAVPRPPARGRAAPGTLTFAPGETSKTVTVQVSGDRLPEANETFFVNLSGPTNAVITDGQGLGTIVDDEPRISIGDVTNTEGKRNQTTLFTFTV